MAESKHPETLDALYLKIEQVAKKYFFRFSYRQLLEEDTPYDFQSLIDSYLVDYKRIAGDNFDESVARNRFKHIIMTNTKNQNRRVVWDIQDVYDC